MSLLKVNESTVCKACGAEIVFVKMKSGKMNPVNASPVYIVVTDDGRVEAGRISHFATCPEAKRFRKKEKPCNTEKSL